MLCTSCLFVTCELAPTTYGTSAFDVAEACHVITVLPACAAEPPSPGSLAAPQCMAAPELLPWWPSSCRFLTDFAVQ